MLAFNERFRIAVLETVLRRNDREFVRRMEIISGMLMPPSHRGARPPLDDATPIRDRPIPPSPTRGVRVRGWVSRSWHRIMAILWVGCLIALAIGATTSAGTVVCAVAAGILLAVVWRRTLRAFGQRLSAAATRRRWRSSAARRPGVSR